MLRSVTFLGIVTAVVKPAWFAFITAACMRLLGAEGFGIFTTALALCMLVMAFSDLGTAEYSVREVARDRSRASSFFSNFMLLRLWVSAIALACSVLVAFLLGYSREALLAVFFAGLYVGALGLLVYCRVFFEAFQNLRVDAISIAMEKILVIAFGLAILVLTRDPAATLAGMAAGVLLTLSLNLAWVSRRFAPFAARSIQFAFLRRHLRSSITFGIAGVLSIVYYRTDLVMVEALRGPVEAGQYAVAFRILEALNLLPFVVVQAAMYPRLSALARHAQYDTFVRLMRLGGGPVVALSLGIAVFLTLFGPWFVNVLDPDPAYAPAGAALQVLCWTFPLTCANALLYVALLALDEQKFRAQALAATVALNIAMNFVLIPEYGIIGAAVATIASEVFVVVVYAHRYRTTLAKAQRVRHTVAGNSEIGGAG
jgi:O-antigen/teichoic acid export membrane protein